MIKYSSPPKEHTVRTSGPKPYNYNTGRAGTLLTMMQTGDSVSPAYKKSFSPKRTPGAALLARALQGQKDRSLLEDYERQEAERQGKGGLWGSILGTVGGLAGGMLGGAPGAAIGQGLGTGLGEKFGAGKAKDYDKSGTVYSQESFEDINRASDEYQSGIVGRAGMAGVKAGLTAGLTPGGGIYGEYNPFTKQGWQSFGKLAAGEGVTGYGSPENIFSFADPQYASATAGKISGPITGSAQGYSPLPSLSEIIGNVFTRGEGLQDGGLIGMQTGGLTAQSVLQEQGLTATPDQLALFEAFDPYDIIKARKEIGQAVSDTTGGGISSVDTGFGASQGSLMEMLEKGEESYQDTISSEQKEFASQTLGTAADIVAGGGNIAGYKHINAPKNPNLNDTYSRGSEKYYWDGSQWKLVVDYNQQSDSDDYQSDMNLKENINLTGLSDSGINIYTFEYKDKKYGEGVYRGVMAQEVPWASFEADNGYLAVDYSKVDVDFEQVV